METYNERLDPFLSRVDLCVTLLDSSSMIHWIRILGWQLILALAEPWKCSLKAQDRTLASLRSTKYV